MNLQELYNEDYLLSVNDVVEAEFDKFAFIAVDNVFNIGLLNLNTGSVFNNRVNVHQPFAISYEEVSKLMPFPLNEIEYLGRLRNMIFLRNYHEKHKN